MLQPDEGEPSRRGRLSFNQALAITAAQSLTAGFFFDFDGTLAPIQDDPVAVQPTIGVSPLLDELSQMVRRVAIVSARPVGFLQSRFPTLDTITLFGLYGLEVRHSGGKISTTSDALPWLSTMRKIADVAERTLPSGVLVEYKRLSVALHYRQAPEQREAVESWVNDQARLYGLKRQDGRMVVELKPPIERDKGEVIWEQTADLTCAWYFGDDLGDLAAFRRLREREALEKGFVGIRAAVANYETGRELTKQADLQIESPSQVPDYLTRIVDALR